MIFRAFILLLMCLSVEAQYTATHYIDFEGGTDATDVTITTLNNSLHGPAMVAGSCGTVWCITMDTTHGLQFTTAGQSSLLGPISVYGTSGYGPGGSLGIVSKTDDSHNYILPCWGANGSASASVALKFRTDVPIYNDGVKFINIDWFAIRTVAGTFNNLILYCPGDGTCKFTQEISVGSPDTHPIAFNTNTVYWVLGGIQVGGTNGNPWYVYDASGNFVDSIHPAGTSFGSNPYRTELGISNGGGNANTYALGYHIWIDNVMINTNGDFPLLPGPNCTLAFLMPSNSIPWKLGQNVGVPGGIPTRTVYTNLTTGNLGATPAAVINQAISVCPSNQTVKLPAGTINLEAGITMYGYNGVTLKGAGMGKTILNPVAGNSAISLGTDSGFSAGTSISSGWDKGASNLTVASTAGLAVNQMVACTELMDTNMMWTSQRVADTNGSSRMITHIALIKAIAGSVVTIWPPLTYGQTPTYGGLMHHFGGVFQQMNNGVEDLTIDCSAANVTYGIVTSQAYSCWQSNVEIKMVTGYCDYTYKSTLCEFTKVYINQQPSYGSSHGGILLGNGNGTNAATGCAVYNCILNQIQPGVQVNGGSAGNVIAYNLGYDNHADGAQAMSFDSNHGGQNNMNLYEGNIGNMFDTDGNFSGVLMDTFYRNWATGWGPTDTNQNSRPFSLAKWSLYETLVGNVIGHTNIATPDYYTPTNDIGYGSNCVYWLGFPNGSGNGTYTNTRPPSLDRVGALDLNVSNTATFYANWDSYYKSNNFFGRTDICATNLPNSLYLTTAPAWFANLSWPPINSTNGYTNLYYTAIPAGFRFFNGYWPDEATGTAPVTFGGGVRLSGGAKINLP